MVHNPTSSVKSNLPPERTMGKNPFEEGILLCQQTLEQLSYVITPAAYPETDATGETVHSLTETVMGITAGLVAIAGALNRIADAINDSANKN